MRLTHTNSVYAEDITLIDYVKYPQYVHQVSDGGPLVKRGIRIMPGELIDYVLRGKHGASVGTADYIQELLSDPSRRVGFILACGGGTWAGYDSTLVKSTQYPVYQMPTLGSTQVYAGYLANRLGKFHYIATDCVSCISGHSAWYSARNMLKLGLLDAVVVVSSDNGIAEDYLAVFGEFGLSKSLAEEDTDVCKFHLGQGANISVFESDACVEATGHETLAEILDIHVTAEVHNSPLGMANTGEGYRQAIGGVVYDTVDFVKTHSTFSQDNKVEGLVIAEVFGDIRTVNYKLRIGHTLGASTAIETTLAIKEESGTFLSLGAGMGNVFSAAVVRITNAL